MRVGLIGGTGMYDWGRSAAIGVETPWGDVELHHAHVKDADVFFVPRHGRGHEVPAHKVEYRALVAALKAAKCTYVIAVNNVGSLVKGIRPGRLVVPHDFIDRTRRRADTFHDGQAVHVHPVPAYCPDVRQALTDAAGAVDGVYAAVEGPRFETKTEAQELVAAGAHVIGMTGYPEVVLAREAGLHYASLCYVANHAVSVAAPVSARTIQRRMANDRPRVAAAVRKAIGKLDGEPTCDCTRGLDSARLAVAPA
jgi:5'-methylthioadenosine phosphorylase